MWFHFVVNDCIRVLVRASKVDVSRSYCDHQSLHIERLSKRATSLLACTLCSPGAASTEELCPEVKTVPKMPTEAELKLQAKYDAVRKAKVRKFL